MAQKVTITEIFPLVFGDVSLGFTRVAKRLYGSDALYGPIVNIFKWERGMELVTIKIGPHEVENGIKGFVFLRGFPGSFFIYPGNEDSPPYICVTVHSKHREAAENFLQEVCTQIETQSIYKGKTLLFGAGGIEFLELGTISSERIVYNDTVLRKLNEYVWTVIENTELCEAAMIPGQRKVLFKGPYGSGKTLTALLTAQKAAARGWTVIYLEPTSAGATNAVYATYRFAQKYQPAFVIIEDMDREQRAESADILGRILVAVDGIVSKNAKIFTIMTTNFGEKIAGGMQRPGRIDRVIDFHRFDPADIKKLLLATVPVCYIADVVDWERVAASCQDYSPVFVVEVGRGAVLSAIHRNKKNPFITEEMLLHAAEDLRPQFDACNAQFGFGKR